MASSSRLSAIPGSSGSKRTRTSAELGVSGEEAMAWEAAVVKREVKPEEEEAWVWPRPMKGLGEPGPAPFVAKAYELVADAATDAVVSWADDRGSSLVVWDPHALAAAVLPRFFKHPTSPPSSGQLNTSGFRKVNPDRWEFANEAFLAGQKNLLEDIRRRRRRPSKHQIESQLRNGTSVCHGQPESLNGIVSLKRDGAALRAEIITLERQYKICKSQLISMEQRVLNNKRKQQQLISFFAKALSNPVFVQQFLPNYTDKKELRSTAIGQQLVENEEQQVVDALLKSTTAGSSDYGSGTATNGQPMTKGSDQNIRNMCNNVWEELDALPGTQIKQEGKFDIGLDIEFTRRPCGWIDYCPYLVEPMQFVEH